MLRELVLITTTFIKLTRIEQGWPNFLDCGPNFKQKKCCGPQKIFGGPHAARRRHFGHVWDRVFYFEIRKGTGGDKYWNKEARR